jgi:hypothetical protein
VEGTIELSIPDGAGNPKATSGVEGNKAMNGVLKKTRREQVALPPAVLLVGLSNYFFFVAAFALGLAAAFFFGAAFFFVAANSLTSFP